MVALQWTENEWEGDQTINQPFPTDHAVKYLISEVLLACSGIENKLCSEESSVGRWHFSEHLHSRSRLVANSGFVVLFLRLGSEFCFRILFVF